MHAIKAFPGFWAVIDTSGRTVATCSTREDAVRVALALDGDEPGRRESVILTASEAKSVHGLIDELTGGNAHSAFAWDGTDDPSDPRTSALAKIYRCAGREVPDALKSV